MASPIQMKAATTACFSLSTKYERIAQLLLAYIWYANDPDQARTYALRYDEAKNVADQVGWTSTESWHRGAYSTTRPSQRLQTLLAPTGCARENGAARSRKREPQARCRWSHLDQSPEGRSRCNSRSSGLVELGFEPIKFTPVQGDIRGI